MDTLSFEIEMINTLLTLSHTSRMVRRTVSRPEDTRNREGRECETVCLSVCVLKFLDRRVSFLRFLKINISDLFFQLE